MPNWVPTGQFEPWTKEKSPPPLGPNEADKVNALGPLLVKVTPCITEAPTCTEPKFNCVVETLTCAAAGSAKMRNATSEIAALRAAFSIAVVIVGNTPDEL